jgi:hypothetical protein
MAWNTSSYGGSTDIDMSSEDAVAVWKCKLETIEAGGPLESIPSAEPHASSRKLLNHNHSSLLSKSTNARFSLFFPNIEMVLDTLDTVY